MYLRTRFPPSPHRLSHFHRRHKKYAPPKAHASIPSSLRVEHPRVRRKDFDPYLRAELGHSESMRLEESSIPGLLDQSDSRRTPLPPKLLPPLSFVPDIFFKHDFDLGNL
jgi:vacuolar protein sorting-associated protein 54